MTLTVPKLYSACGDYDNNWIVFLFPYGVHKLLRKLVPECNIDV